MPKSFIEWTLASQELPKRDIPVLVVARSPHQEFTAISHRMARGWAGIKAPATIVAWAPLPAPPTLPE